MKRGDVWWAILPAPAGQRPVLLLSRNEAYPIRELITIAPITTRVRDIPAEVPLGPKDGLPKPCVANCDVITTIPKRTLGGYLTTLSVEKMQSVDEAIRFSLGLA